MAKMEIKKNGTIEEVKKLFNILRPQEESFVGEYQAVFCEGRSTTDLADLSSINTDFKASYDSVKIKQSTVAENV